MKNILIPMDFTDVGINALRYAIQAFPESTLSVLYIKAAMVDAEESLTASPVIVQEQYWKEAMKSFIKKELNIETIPDKISIHIEYGPTISSIRNYTDKNNFDAIVMGTRDKYNVFDQWFGTVSIGTVKTSKIPVYLIPKYASCTGYKKVMIASDTHLMNAVYINQIKSWNKEHGSFVKFLHIQRGDKDDFNEATKALVYELFEKEDPQFSFEIDVLKDKDISHSLLASAYDMKADLLIVIPEDQNFLQSLLFKSIAKDLILQADIPLLFLKRKKS